MQMRVIAGPNDVCRCGHKKNFHVYLKDRVEPGESVVEIGDCCQCECPAYDEVPAESK